MSEEQRKDQTDEVEGHLHAGMNDEPLNDGDESDDVSAHMLAGNRSDGRSDGRSDARSD